MEDFKILHISFGEPYESETNEHQRKFLASLARKGAKLGKCGRMCGTCAFRLNSDANLEPNNVSSALKMLISGGTFNCHIESGVDKGCECIGFKHAKQYMENGGLKEIVEQVFKIEA